MVFFDDINNDIKTQFKLSEWDNITLNDSVDGKIRDLKLYGKSEQKQYIGKNLYIGNIIRDGDNYIFYLN